MAYLNIDDMTNKEKAELYREIMYSLFNRYSNKKGPKCKECGKHELEHTMTLTTDEQEVRYYDCQNCGMQNVVD